MTEPTLRHAILAHPEDDAPRLAYADWCDANARPTRGAYIRTQLARALAEPGSPHANSLFTQELHLSRSRPPSENWWQPTTDLLARYRDRIAKPRLSLSFDYSRGFISGVGGDAPELLDTLPDLLALEPITHLWITYPGNAATAPGPLAKLAALPALSRITRLGLNASTDLLRALAVSPHLKNITRFFIYSNPPENHSLDLPQLLPALIAALHTMPAITTLELRGIPLGPIGFRQLATETLPRGRWQSLSLDQAALTDAGAALLAATAGLETLRTLSLRDNALTPAAVAALANSPALPAIEDLDLSENPIDPPGLLAIQKRTAMPHLTRLGIADAVREEVEEEWTDWNGAHLGSGKELRPLHDYDLTTRFPLPHITYYTHP